jgi:hypothetical protein
LGRFFRLLSHRRVAEVAEEIVFSLATERPAREKLQPLRGRALSKTNEALPHTDENQTENISPPQLNSFATVKFSRPV